jgi:excisionase family DNA binding protein
MKTLHWAVYYGCALLASGVAIVLAFMTGNPAWLSLVPELLRFLKPPEKETMLSVREVARRFGVSVATVHRWIQDGHLHSFQMAAHGKHLVEESEVERVLKEKRKVPESAR